MPNRGNGSRRQRPERVILVPVEVSRTIYIFNNDRDRDIHHVDQIRITAAQRTLFANTVFVLISLGPLIYEYLVTRDSSFDKTVKSSVYARTSYIWVLINYAAESIYRLCENFSEISFQVNTILYISATQIGAFVLGTVQFVAFLATLLFVIALVVGRQFHAFSQQYNKCLEDKIELQSKLEEITLGMQKERQRLLLKLEEAELRLQEKCEKLTQETQNCQKLKQETEQRLCGICQDQDKTILLLPCQHLCLCKKCSNRKQWKKCPMCRQDVNSTMEIYV